ncbi:MAG: uracil-xanthine permease family protein [Candidatus Riflebacteria bacterium]
MENEIQLSPVKRTIMGMQMLFVAFGALVLVPLLTGLDPSIALFTAGLGTLIFHAVTGGKVPVFLASSFAFIAPIQFGIKEFGLGPTLGGLVSAGIIYILLAFLVKFKGVEIIERLLPPVVTGPVIMVIGLKLAPVAVNMARSFDGSGNPDSTAIMIAMISLVTVIVVVLRGRGMVGLIPILIGITTGYVVSIFLGKVDFELVKNSPWFVVPWTAAMECGRYCLPTFDWKAIAYILPVAIAPAIEHVGDVVAVSSVAKKDFLREPGLHRTLLGDGIATSVAAFLGGPPNTTYSEVTGAVALLKRPDPVLLRIAAVFAIVLAFLGKVGAILRTIPVPVMGGIMVLLFGMIASIGAQTLVRNRIDFGDSRNLVIVSIILVFGIGDMSFDVGQLKLAGIGLAGLVGVILNMVLFWNSPQADPAVCADEAQI